MEDRLIENKAYRVILLGVLEIVIGLFLSIFLLLLFRFDYFFSDKLIGGGDPISFFYPSAYYLYESLLALRFPFWSERILLGFPVYAISEFSYLNLLHILGTLIFGPFAVFKFEHILFYTLGAFGLFGLLKKFFAIWTA